jgi:hypothetical protein
MPEFLLRDFLIGYMLLSTSFTLMYVLRARSLYQITSSNSNGAACEIFYPPMPQWVLLGRDTWKMR